MRKNLRLAEFDDNEKRKGRSQGSEKESEGKNDVDEETVSNLSIGSVSKIAITTFKIDIL